MSKKATPTVRDRIVAAEFRRLREESGESQAEVEAALKLSAGSLSRWEGLKTSPSAAAARQLFDHYGVSGDKLETLVEFARVARRRDWLQGADETMPAWFEDFRRLEFEASEIRDLSLNVFTGLLQRRDYAEHILRAGIVGSDVEKHVETRMNRKEVLGPRKNQDPLRLWSIIHESVLYRNIGGRDVMLDQLGYVLEMANKPNITIQIIPNDYGAHTAISTPFQLLKFDLAPEFGVVYLEHLTGALYRDTPSEAKLYDNAYLHLIKTALPEVQSLRLIQNVMKELKR